MLRRRGKGEESSSDDGHYYISISDLMTSLLFIFILILSYVMLSFVKKEDVLTEKIKIIEQNIEYRSELLQDLKTQLIKKNINIEIDTKNGNMRLKSDLLFSKGSANISKEGKEQITEIAKLLMQKMSQTKYIQSIDTIFIEGHTDSTPIKSKYIRKWTNKELSAQRAINTYSEMVLSTNNKIKYIKNIKDNSMLSYSGYADNRQRCPEKEKLSNGASSLEMKDCRSQNRRIEFYFTVNTPEITNLKIK